MSDLVGSQIVGFLTHRLISVNADLPTAADITAGSRTCTVDDHDKIMVQKGDLIGW